ncbi:hypothetical protein P7C73_g1008, partial [Tremellales sp. Uapishka_1]
MSSVIQNIPKGLHHLETARRSKFGNKFPSRLPHPPTKYVAPAARIRRWNIVPGDKVRLLVGKPKEKFRDELQGPKGGYRAYKVTSVDMERNRVFLEGLSNKRSNPTRPIPENIADYDENTQRQMKEQANSIRLARPVHYSNVQLCVEDNDGPSSVFASRISTTAPHFDRATRRLRWNRYAAGLSAESSEVPEAEKGLIKIPFPSIQFRPKMEAGPLDTVESDVAFANATFQPASPEPFGSNTASYLFRPARAPLPSAPAEIEEYFKLSNTYIKSPSDRSDPELDSLMPLYLSEELSPRFSRAKATEGWNVRRSQEKQEREAFASDAVSKWEASGRDTGLKEVLELDQIGLEGVSVRGRTRKEVREAALAEFDADVVSKKKEVREARKEGRVYDWEGETGATWLEGEKGVKKEISKARRDRKERRMLQKLAGLKLHEGKNTFVPPELRA